MKISFKNEAHTSVAFLKHYLKEFLPEELPENTMYWYLTQDGWQRHDDINDLGAMKPGLNVYGVACSHRMDFLGNVTGNTKSVWEAVTERYEFENEAVRLTRKYGVLPDAREFYREYEFA